MEAGAAREGARALRTAPIDEVKEVEVDIVEVEVGANVLAGADPARIVECARAMSARTRGWRNPFGDGQSGPRIVDLLLAR